MAIPAILDAVALMLRCPAFGRLLFVRSQGEVIDELAYPEAESSLENRFIGGLFVSGNEEQSACFLVDVDSGLSERPEHLQEEPVGILRRTTKGPEKRSFPHAASRSPSPATDWTSKGQGIFSPPSEGGRIPRRR